MGKNTILNKKKKMAKKKKKVMSQYNIESMSIEDLLTKAQECIDTFNYEEAHFICQEVLKRDADHVSGLETFGNLCAEIQNFEAAMHCYGRAITLMPNEGHSKYLAMAQLMNGTEAVVILEYPTALERIHGIDFNTVNLILLMNHNLPQMLLLCNCKSPVCKQYFNWKC